jgi:hypothetical protein
MGNEWKQCAVKCKDEALINTWTQNNCELHWPLELDTWEAGGDRKTIAHRERTQSFPCIIRCETVRFRLQKYRNGGQLWAVNGFSYTIHAQTDCWQSRSPLALYIFFPLLLWRFRSFPLFCVHYTCAFNWHPSYAAATLNPSVCAQVLSRWWVSSRENARLAEKRTVCPARMSLEVTPW